MDCSHARRDILPLAFDALEQADADALRLHLNTCAPCAARHTNLEDLLGLLVGPAEVTPPPRVWAALARRIAAEEGEADALASPHPATPFTEPVAVGAAGRLELPGYALQEKLQSGPGLLVFRARRIDERPVVVRIFELPAELPDAACPPVEVPPHPLQLGVIDSGRSGGYRYEVLDAVEGPTLRASLGSGPRAPRAVRSILSQLALVARAWHQSGHAHGAIGPDTVLFDRRGDPYLLPPLPRDLAAPRGDLQGLSFLAPELLAAPGAERPCSGDLYAIGLTGHMLLRDAWPWGTQPEEVRWRRELGGALECTGLCDDPPLEELIAELTVHDPGLRLREAQELLDKLAAVPVTVAARAGQTAPSRTRCAPRRPRLRARPGRRQDERLLFRRYRVLDVLEQGCHGTIFRTEHTGLGRPRALQIIGPDILGPDDAAPARLRRALSPVRWLRHANIARLYSTGHDRERVYLASELVGGETLRGLLARQGPLPLGEVLPIARQILAALRAAHGKGIVHGDLQAENVALSGPGEVKLLRFGVASALRAFDAAAGRISSHAAYLSPEQCAGGAGDARADLYALGVLLFEMLTGRMPFEATTPLGFVGQHLLQAPPLLAEAAPDRRFSPRLEALVRRLLTKDVERRFQTAAEVEHALQGLEAEPAGGPGFWTRVGGWLGSWVGLRAG